MCKLCRPLVLADTSWSTRLVTNSPVDYENPPPQQKEGNSQTHFDVFIGFPANDNQFDLDASNEPFTPFPILICRLKNISLIQLRYIYLYSLLLRIKCLEPCALVGRTSFFCRMLCVELILSIDQQHALQQCVFIYLQVASSFKLSRF